MSVRRRQILVFVLLFAVSCGLSSNLCLGQQSPASGGGCGCSHGHDDHDHHDHDHGHGHQHSHSHDESKVSELKKKLLPEELAEEEDLKLYGFGSTHDHHLHHHTGHNHDHDRLTSHSHLSGAGLWFYAMGCSLLVSLASLICLILLPLMFVRGKPSKLLVDSLALFGAGAMLGDAFLHQMPHAYGGDHSHSHDHNDGHDHAHSGEKHAHSLKDLSVGLSVLAGIVLFLIVEKLVRYIEEVSGDSNSWGHSHHHHHKKSKKSKGSDVAQVQSSEDEISETTSKVNDKKQSLSESGLKKRKKKGAHADEKPITDSVSSSLGKQEPSRPSSNLVFGYLNLFSDGVHNFTDGMALGSAFLLYGSVGGWSRTLFLLAHELPQEIGDFGILVRSGFSVSKALFFNFLSALVALAGTALALLLGQDPGHSSLIEGFTAGGFIYIAVAGVLAEMNNSGSSAWKSTIIQLVALTSGMAVALGISLVE